VELDAEAEAAVVGHGRSFLPADRPSWTAAGTRTLEAT